MDNNLINSLSKGVSRYIGTHKVSLPEDELERTRRFAEQHKETARNLKDQVESLESQQADTSRTENGFDENWQVVREEMHRESRWMPF